MFLFLFLIALIKADSIEFQCPPTTASIEYLLDKSYIPGASIIVLNREKILYEKGIGYHSPPIPEERHPMDASSSIFVLASISKTFIAVAAMQMVELNLLNLDEDINKYLSPRMKINHPFYPNDIITTRHLLTHTAGIGVNLVEEYKLYLPSDDFTKTNLGNVIKKYLSYNASWLPISPGHNITSYSNVGASLAAFIVERLANISFEEYVQENILKVLGIDKENGGYRLSNFQNKKQNLVGHYIYNTSWLQTFKNMVPQLNVSRVDNVSDWLYVPFYGISRYPAGYLRMSANSLSLFFQSFLNNFPRLLQNLSSIEQIIHVAPQVSYMNMTSSKYGLLWYWKMMDGRRLIGHDGSVPGITTIMMANEKRNLGIIILTNGDTVRDDSQAEQVQTTINYMTKELFDCFEKSTNKGSTYRSFNFLIYGIITIFNLLIML
jgi:CubicO group peptidase (beta-lactamase class C family)